ncbi:MULTISPECIES: hypothetical protein [unclassified Bradyrhizobium]|uniref:hypothetical protein n=1 Tax=unclassified Bradyrhizobium TaxID=2631580 RepID=UPI003397D68B
MVVVRKRVRRNLVSDWLSVSDKRRDWTYRRIIVFGIIAIACVWITWAAGWMRVETANTMISNAFNALMVVVTGYVFGAVLDDHLRRKSHTDNADTDSETDIDPDRHHTSDAPSEKDNKSPDINVTVGIDNTPDNDGPPISRNGGR